MSSLDCKQCLNMGNQGHCMAPQCHFKLKNNLPLFVMLVGLPGAGKSTFAKKYADENDLVYLSSDKIREELYGDENCQDNPSKVFEVLRLRTLDYLKKGIGVIYDATNINRKNRLHLLNNIQNISYKKCIIIWEDINKCIENDLNRNRTVGKPIIEKMANNFQTPYYDEGWDEIEIKYTSYPYDEKDEIKLLDNLNISHDNPYHKGTIKQHVDEIKRLIDEDFKINKLNEEEYSLLKEVAVWHDIGKPFVKQFKEDKNGNIKATYYGHQNISAYLTLGKKEYKNRLLISYLVNLHMEPFQNSNFFKEKANNFIKRLVIKFNKYDKESEF